MGTLEADVTPRLRPKQKPPAASDVVSSVHGMRRGQRAEIDMAPREEARRPSADRIRNTLLAIIAVLLVIAGLRWGAPVTMPLAFAGFLIALCWPIQEWLNRRLPVSRASASSARPSRLLVLFVAALFFTGRNIWRRP